MPDKVEEPPVKTLFNTFGSPQMLHWKGAGKKVIPISKGYGKQQAPSPKGKGKQSFGYHWLSTVDEEYSLEGSTPKLDDTELPNGK